MSDTPKGFWWYAYWCLGKLNGAKMNLGEWWRKKTGKQ